MSNITDPTTGFPTPPTGYKWHVKFTWSSYSTIPDATISLREDKWSWWFHSWYEHEVRLGVLDPRDVEAGRDGYNRHHDLIPLETEFWPAALFEGAEKLLTKHAKALKFDEFHNQATEAMKKLKGYYPPNKLPDLVYPESDEEEVQDA